MCKDTAAVISVSNEPGTVLTRAFAQCREGGYMSEAYGQHRPKRSADEISYSLLSGIWLVEGITENIQRGATL